VGEQVVDVAVPPPPPLVAQLLPQLQGGDAVAVPPPPPPLVAVPPPPPPLVAVPPPPPEPIAGAPPNPTSAKLHVPDYANLLDHDSNEDGWIDVHDLEQIYHQIHGHTDKQNHLVDTEEVKAIFDDGKMVQLAHILEYAESHEIPFEEDFKNLGKLLNGDETARAHAHMLTPEGSPRLIPHVHDHPEIFDPHPASERLFSETEPNNTNDQANDLGKLSSDQDIHISGHLNGTSDPYDYFDYVATEAGNIDVIMYRGSEIIYNETFIAQQANAHSITSGGPREMRTSAMIRKSVFHQHRTTLW
jgi:hypothetical protein